MPTLVQIQNYLRNMRRQLGKTNNIVEIEKFVKENNLRDDLGPDEFFCFGSELGDGIIYIIFLYFNLIIYNK